MNNYLMFKQILKTAYIPPDKQDHDFFKQPIRKVNVNGVEKHITPSMRRVKAIRHQMNKPLSDKAVANREERAKRK